MLSWPFLIEAKTGGVLPGYVYQLHCQQASVDAQPCYLCKQTGHTTMTCPYRIAPEHGCVQAANLSSDTLLATVLQREQHGRYVADHTGILPSPVVGAGSGEVIIVVLQLNGQWQPFMGIKAVMLGSANASDCAGSVRYTCNSQSGRWMQLCSNFTLADASVWTSTQRRCPAVPRYLVTANRDYHFCKIF